MLSSSESAWSVESGRDEDYIDDFPNQLFVSLVTQPAHVHQSRVTSHKPAAPPRRLVKVPVGPNKAKTLRDRGVRQAAGDATQERPHDNSLLPAPPVVDTVPGSSDDADEETSAPPRKRARVPLEEKIRTALCTQPGGAVEDASLDTLVTSVVTAVRDCGDDAGLVASLIVNGLSDPLNETLRTAVVTGTLTPARLVTLNDEEFLNPQRREELHVQRQERMDQRSVDYVERLMTPVTKLFTCPSCGCKECFANFRSTDFVKWQGDDPNPTLLTCTRCGLAFKM